MTFYNLIFVCLDFFAKSSNKIYVIFFWGGGRINTHQTAGQNTYNIYHWSLFYSELCFKTFKFTIINLNLNKYILYIRLKRIVLMFRIPPLLDTLG